MSKVVDGLEKFDLPKKTAIALLFIVIGIWAGLSAFEELDFEHEDCKSFGKRVEFGIGICTDYGKRLYFMTHYAETERFQNPIRVVTFELLELSKNVFDDYRIIPFISSGFVLLLTYFITFEITRRNYTGLVAVLFVLHSPIFFKYDLIMTYPTFWVAFFLFSIYLTFKTWQLSPVSFFLGCVSKIMNVMNFPAMILFVYLSGNPQWKKIVGVYGVIMGLGIGGVVVTKWVYPEIWYRFYGIMLTQFEVNLVDFLWWLGMWSIELFSDKITLFSIFLLIPCLFMLKKAKIQGASAILVMILVFILQPAFISGFTNYTNEDYRFLPLVIFVGIGIAFLLPNLKVLSKAFADYFTLKKK